MTQPNPEPRLPAARRLATARFAIGGPARPSGREGVGRLADFDSWLGLVRAFKPKGCRFPLTVSCLHDACLIQKKVNH
ncbi:hypothetical protein scyTo_0000106 [Scyliorhinus torazame]|uniref:Uncharacterized protein n=1 Tax=Scyliorhinus torazame TaxID=75743 RepID=A0A401NQ97_SCYTO|nr:hypothetical protein [Scyliorhinus torazame]